MVFTHVIVKYSGKLLPKLTLMSLDGYANDSFQSWSIYTLQRLLLVTPYFQLYVWLTWKIIACPIGNKPQNSRASNIIFRLMDDIGGISLGYYPKLILERRRYVLSSIDCYMEQYKVSEQETLDVFNKQVMDMRKDINEEFLDQLPCKGLSSCVFLISPGFWSLWTCFTKRRRLHIYWQCQGWFGIAVL
ncbi:hypothetical protein DVH24_003516 [Malus domestica]|uniref:Terpene synthase metal-binding domain-containing protein n=1 Tax=Malus domestica TaxID=3750 RepID=A0A498IHC3_MALDO|nr:hypothetical protein DVH24_003516 [Malus domestica]